MARQDDDDKPWKRLYHGDQLEKKESDQLEGITEEQCQQETPTPAQQQDIQSEALSELQQQMLTAFRKTCLVAGAGLAGSVWQWNTQTKHTRQQVFLPPRAQALPPEVVKAWQQKALMNEALETVGRQAVFITGVAALYFGVELCVGRWRGKPDDWLNTAAAGAAAGGWLGIRAPSSMRSRTVALGCVAGGLLGGLSGWSQQHLAQWAAEGSGSSSQQQQQESQQQQQQQSPQQPQQMPTKNKS